jgi:predicted ATPase
MVARGLGFSEKFGFFSHKAELQRLHGDLLLVKDPANVTEAERCYRTALDVARKQNAKSWELRATTSLARMLAQRGHGAEARAMLADIYGWFTEGFETRDLIEAKALLDQLNG